MEVVNVVELLRLERLDHVFVDAAWKDDFLVDRELPSDFQRYLRTINVCAVLDNITQTVYQWQSSRASRGNVNDDEDTGKSWKDLTECRLNRKALLALLWHFIVQGRMNIAVEESRNISLKAAALYLEFLAIPGSKTFFAFHPYLCIHAVDCLKFSVLLISRQKEPMEDDFEELLYLPANEKEILSWQLSLVLNALSRFIKNYRLNIEEDLLTKIVENLTDLTRTELNSSAIKILDGRVQQASFAALATKGYTILLNLCTAKHGNVEYNLLIIMKNMLPSLLLRPTGHKYDLTFSEVCVVREHAVHFVQYILLGFTEQAYHSVKILVHHVFVEINDKAEYRKKGAQTVVEIMRVLPNDKYIELLGWLLDFAHCDKASYRLYTLDIIFRLLYNDLNTPPSTPTHSSDRQNTECKTPVNGIDDNPDTPVSEVDGEREYFFDSAWSADAFIGYNESHLSGINALPQILSDQRDDICYKCILAVLFARCRDCSGMVRAKALALVAHCTSTNNFVVSNMMYDIFVKPYESGNVKLYSKDFFKYEEIKIALEEQGAIDPLPGAETFVEVVKEMISDEKVPVRKAALQVLEGLMKLSKVWLTDNLLKLIGQHCRDPASTIRRQAAQILTDLLDIYPDCPQLECNWTIHIPPLIFNQDLKLQETAYDNMKMILIYNVAPCGSILSSNELPWKIISHLAQLEHELCYIKFCEMCIKDNVIGDEFVKTVCTHIGTTNDNLAWMCLSLINDAMKLKDPLFAVTYYRETFSKLGEKSEVETLRIVLNILKKCCSNLPREVQEDFHNELHKAVFCLSVPAQLIQANFDLIITLRHLLASSREESQQEIQQWTKQLLKTSEEFLRETLDKQASSFSDHEKFLRHVCTFGEALAYNPCDISRKLFLQLKNYVFSLDDKGKMGSIPAFRPFLLIILGRLCVLSKERAKSAAPKLPALMNKITEIPARINIIHIMKDLIVRHGSLMEHLVKPLWLCVKESDNKIRNLAVKCIVDMLQENHLKLKGPSIFYLLSILVDDKTEIAEQAAQFMFSFLVEGDENIMQRHFIEAFFHFNGYKGHESYCQYVLTREEQRRFLLTGEKHHDKRMTIYKFMMSNMNDEHRFKATNALVKEILGAAAEGVMRLDRNGENVLKDAILALRCDEIQLTPLQSTADEDFTEDNMEFATNIFCSTKSNVIDELCEQLLKLHITSTEGQKDELAHSDNRQESVKAEGIGEGHACTRQCMKRHLMNSIIPVVTRLKAVLIKCHSRVTSHLLEYITEILKAYRDEIGEMFTEDKITGEEVSRRIKLLQRKRKLEQSHSQNLQSSFAAVSAEVLAFVENCHRNSKVDLEHLNWLLSYANETDLKFCMRRLKVIKQNIEEEECKKINVYLKKTKNISSRKRQQRRYDEIHSGGKKRKTDITAKGKGSPRNRESKFSKNKCKSFRSDNTVGNRSTQQLESSAFLERRCVIEEKQNENPDDVIINAILENVVGVEDLLIGMSKYLTHSSNVSPSTSKDENINFHHLASVTEGAFDLIKKATNRIENGFELEDSRSSFEEGGNSTNSNADIFSQLSKHFNSFDSETTSDQNKIVNALHSEESEEGLMGNSHASNAAELK